MILFKIYFIQDVYNILIIFHFLGTGWQPTMASGSRTHHVLKTQVTENDKLLKRHKLPTNMDILRSKIAYSTIDGLSLLAANWKVIKDIKLVWELAAIPTITDVNIFHKIDRYYKKYDAIRKVNVNIRNEESFNMKVKDLLDEGERLMDISGNISNLNKEDIQFLENMRTIRTGCMGRRDVITQNKAKIALEREKKKRRG